MKRLIPLGIALLLIVALVFINHSIGKSAKPDDDDAQTQTTQKASPAKAAPAAAEAPGTVLLPEVTIGDPAKAKYKIAVGWVYDEKNMADAGPLTQALQVVQKIAAASGGTTSAEIVNLDLPASDLTPAAANVTGLGVTVNGSEIGPSVNPGEDGLTAELLAKSLAAATH